MGAWLACMVTMTVAGRETASRIDAFQVMELRAVIGFLLLYPLVRSAGGLAAMKPRHPWRHLWRNIVRPSAGHIEPGQLISLAAAVGFAVSVVLVKALTRTEPVVRIIFWMLVIQGIIGIVPAWLVWQPVPLMLWPWILLVAFVGTFSHFSMAQAMRHTDATMVVPMDFLRVPLTAVAGWLIYSEVIDIYTVAGAALILGGNLLTLRRPAPHSA